MKKLKIFFGSLVVLGVVFSPIIMPGLALGYDGTLWWNGSSFFNNPYNMNLSGWAWISGSSYGGIHSLNSWESFRGGSLFYGGANLLNPSWSSSLWGPGNSVYPTFNYDSSYYGNGTLWGLSWNGSPGINSLGPSYAPGYGNPLPWSGSLWLLWSNGWSYDGFNSWGLLGPNSLFYSHPRPPGSSSSSHSSGSTPSPPSTVSGPKATLVQPDSCDSIPLNAVFVVEFTKPIDKSTVNQDTFYIKGRRRSETGR